MVPVTSTSASVRVHPHVRHAEYCFGAEGGGGQNHIPHPEFYDGEFENLGVPSLGYVRLGFVHSHGPAVGTERGKMGLPDEQALLLQLVKLPFYEFPVARRYGIHQTRVVDEKSEFLPVVLHVHLAEVFHDLRRVGKAGNNILGASVVPEILDHCSVISCHLLCQTHGGQPRCMKARGEADAVSRHPLVACYDVGVGKSPHMAHMKITGNAGVRKMDEEFLISFRFPLVKFFGKPSFLPLALYGCEIDHQRQ